MCVLTSRTTDIFTSVLVGTPARYADPLPDWVAYLVNIGASLGCKLQEKAPQTIALSLPTRTYAAVMIALGAVHLRSALPLPEQGNFELLWEAEPGITVRVRHGTREQRGSLKEKVVANGTRYLVIATSKTATYRVPEAMAHNIVAVGTTHKRPQRSRELSVQDPWLAIMLEGCDLGSYLFHNRHDVLVIGHESGIREEARLQMHLRSDSGQLLSGRAATLLRVRSWQSASTPFSSEVLPTVTDTSNVDLGALSQFHIVVLDGSGPYIKWGKMFETQHHVVLLDRTENRFYEGADALNKAFMERDGEVLASLMRAPKGVEFTAFRRRL